MVKLPTHKIYITSKLKINYLNNSILFNINLSASRFRGVQGRSIYFQRYFLVLILVKLNYYSILVIQRVEIYTIYPINLYF